MINELVVRSILKKINGFSQSSITWWPNSLYLDEDLKNLKETFKNEKDNQKLDKLLQVYSEHRIACYVLNVLQAHAYIHNDGVLPKSSDKIDLLDLKNYWKPCMLRVNQCSNLKEGWTYFTADYYEVFNSLADYFLHGYLNENGDDYITWMLVKWNGGLRNIINMDIASEVFEWCRRKSDESLFIRIRYDNLIRSYSNIVVAYDVNYWAQKGIDFNIEDCPPVQLGKYMK